MTAKSRMIAGYYGFGNTGDELILLALVQKYRSENPAVRLTVLSADPSMTARTFGVDSVNRRHPWSWIRPLFDAEEFILGGGGLLQESTGPWNYFYYLSLVVLAKIMGCRTTLLAIGVDPIQRPWNRFWTRFVLHHWSDQISVRDAFSRNALLAAGVQSKIDVTRDPVFEFSATHSQKPQGIALALSAPKPEDVWFQAYADLCDHLSKAGCVPIDLLVLFPSQDEAFSLKIAECSRSIRQVRICKKPQDLLAWIPDYQIVAGSRFHALVLAAVHHIPFIGWGKQPKVATLCAQYKMPFWTPSELWNQGQTVKVIRALYNFPNKSVILKN